MSISYIFSLKPFFLFYFIFFPSSQLAFLSYFPYFLCLSSFFVPFFSNNKSSLSFIIPHFQTRKSDDPLTKHATPNNPSNFPPSLLRCISKTLCSKQIPWADQNILHVQKHASGRLTNVTNTSIPPRIPNTHSNACNSPNVLCSLNFITP